MGGGWGGYVGHGKKGQQYIRISTGVSYIVSASQNTYNE